MASKRWLDDVYIGGGISLSNPSKAGYEYFGCVNGRHKMWNKRLERYEWWEKARLPLKLGINYLRRRTDIYQFAEVSNPEQAERTRIEREEEAERMTRERKLFRAPANQSKRERRLEILGFGNND